MKVVMPSTLLRAAWIVDAGAGAAFAIAQLAATDRLAQWLQLPAALLLETGLFLVPWSLLLLALARSRRTAWLACAGVIAANLAWALAAIAVALAASPSPLGLAWLALHAGGPALFAAVQWLGLQRSPAAASGPVHAA